MRWTRMIRVALKNIMKNKMRSLLTMLGIIIGVGSVIALISLGEGTQADVEKQISSLGTNLLIVMPGAARVGGVSRGASSFDTLTLKDVEKLKKDATLLKYVSPEVKTSDQIIAGSANWSTTISGVGTEYLHIKDWELSQGRFFTEREEKTMAKVAVLGNTVADELFSNQNPVGERIRIRNIPFKVIGVLTEKGQSSMGPDQDDLILAPTTTVLYRMTKGKHIHSIMAGAVSSELMEDAQKELETLLREYHRLTSEEVNNFTVRSQTELSEVATKTTGTITMFLSAIAGVSLLVGGIGIMNIMLVSVTERTREIGIRLAVGAHKNDILVQFLVEAVILSLMGGLIGIALGFGIAFSVGRIMGMSSEINPLIIGVSFLFSGAVGVFFGLYPAGKAANLNPIEALHYE
ncbi:ABC transporter permease [bacterium]|nr:ABC transporter permease [bacterium]